MSWFTNEGKYHTLDHCMAGDVPWIALVLILCGIIAFGYFVIAVKWWNAERTSEATRERDALRDLRLIFSLCAVCGYVWPWVDLVWPAWRLQALMLALLAFFTIRYAMSPISVNVVYDALVERKELIDQVKIMQRQMDTLSQKMNDNIKGGNNE